MGTYGRNFDFRIPPDGDERFGRYCTPITGSKIPIGAPVVSDIPVGFNPLGLQVLKLAKGPQAPPKTGGGILLYEYAPAAFAGLDEHLVTYSDLDTVPLGAAAQVIHHPGVKAVLTNTANTPYPDFTAQFRSGPRVMVAGLGATPSVGVGDFLTPSSGDDVNGYWEKTASATNAWLVVTKVDSARQEVEAEMLF